MTPECLNIVQPILIWKFLACKERIIEACHESIGYGTPEFTEKATKYVEVIVKSLTLKLLYSINITSYSYFLHYLHSFIVNH